MERTHSEEEVEGDTGEELQVQQDLRKRSRQEPRDAGVDMKAGTPIQDGGRRAKAAAKANMDDQLVDQDEDKSPPHRWSRRCPPKSSCEVLQQEKEGGTSWEETFPSTGRDMMDRGLSFTKRDVGRCSL